MAVEPEDSCSFVFEPESWEEDHDRDCPFDEPIGCTHSRYSDEVDQCLFHLSEEKRRDVDTDEYRSEFLNSIQNEGRESKLFIGVSLPHLDLKNTIIESRDKFPIRFICSELGGLLLSNAGINQPFQIINSEIGTIRAEHVDFSAQADCRFRGSIFDGPVNFSGSKFRRAFFNDSEFRKRAEFDHADFGELHVFESTFKSGVNFTWSHCEGRFHISRSVIEGEANFSYSEFERDTRFRSSTFSNEAKFAHSNFRGTTFANAKFENGVDFSYTSFSEIAHFTPDDKTLLANANFRGACFENGGIFADVTFEGKTSFVDADFDGLVVFDNSTFSGQAIFSQSSFSDRVQMTGITCENEFLMEMAESEDRAYFDNSIFESNASFNDSAFGGLYLDEVEFRTSPTLNRSELAEVSFSIVPVDIQILISLAHAQIEKGRIVHPEEYYALYDFSRATIGDVELYSETVENVLDPLQFVETSFDGFDFKRYREDLEDCGWMFSSAKVDEEKIEEGLFSTEEYFEEATQESFGSMASLSDDANLHPDVSRPNEYEETTYQRAKNGAKLVGDSKAASEFLIKEMVMRRRRYKAELISALPILALLDNPKHIFDIREIANYPHRTSDAVPPAIRWVINTILRYSSGYGERLRYVFGWSMAIITMGAILYPIPWFGGLREVRSGETIVHQYEWANIGSSLITPSKYIQMVSSLFDLLIISFFHSVRIFTTLGSGSYTLASWYTESFAAIESFAGAFLIALFVYSLGKQVER